MTNDTSKQGNERMGERPLDPTTQAIKIERLEGRQNSLEQLVKASNDRLELTMQGLSDRLEKWFDDYERQRDEWRNRHEADNEETQRELEKEIRSVRETVIRSIGIGSGVGLFGGVIISGFMWTLNYRFTEQAQDVQRVEQTSGYNRSLIDAQTVEINDIKLYLARGGRIPDEPYVPRSQRSQANEQPSTRKP